MTLIVGLRCNNGVVVGTDSAMTLVSGQRHTIEQPLRRKIDIVQDDVIVAGTGAVGLGQRFIAILERFWKEPRNREANAVETGRQLAKAAVHDFAETGAKQGTYGALVALPCKGNMELIEFAISDFQPEVKTDDYWYASMGSGQAVADPLLGFIRHTFWGDSPPSRQDGVFAATMVLKLGCQMAPMGVAPPIQMAVLRKDDQGNLKVRRVEEEELLEHEDNVDSAIEYFRGYQEALHRPESSSDELPPLPGAEV